MGATPLFVVRHLLGPDRRKLLGRHAGTGKHALLLHGGRGRDHQGGVAPPLSAGFEEERHVKHDERAPLPCRATQKGAFFLTHEGMHDGFEAPHRMRPPDYALGKP
jgi:hypothetical protein